MATYNNSVTAKFDTAENGNAGAGASITVYLAGTTTKANITHSGTSPNDNPMFADGDGNYSFEVDSGIYDIVINESNLSRQDLKGVFIGMLGFLDTDNTWDGENKFTDRVDFEGAFTVFGASGGQTIFNNGAVFNGGSGGLFLGCDTKTRPGIEFIHDGQSSSVFTILRASSAGVPLWGTGEILVSDQDKTITSTYTFQTPTLNPNGVNIGSDLVDTTAGNNSGQSLTVGGSYLLNVGDISTINVGNSTTKVTAESGVEARIVRARTENNSWSGQQDFGTITASTSSLGVADSGTMEVGSVGTTPIGGTLTVHGSIGLNGPVEFRDMTGGGSTVSLININGNLQANGSAVATKTSPSATVWDDGNLIRETGVLNSLSFVQSYGTSVTEGASSSFSGTYEILGEYVSVEIMIDLDSSDTPVVGDRLLFDGLPSSIYPDDNRTAMGIAECYGSFVNGNHAFYQVTSQADGLFGLTCQNVFGAISYQGILHISLRYKVA